MFSDYVKKLSELTSIGEPYVMAVVVRSKPPSSGRPGDKALIQANGKIFGWIGGGCAQPIVTKEAREAIKDGKPRLIRISPEGEEDHQSGVILYTMTCHSGGTLDIYMEPILPLPQLIIMGRSAVAQKLCKVGKAMGYAVLVLAPDAEAELFPEADSISNNLSINQSRITPQTYIVVSTQGEYDEEALENAVKMRVPYIGFVSSKKKSRAVFKYLVDSGIKEDVLEQVHTPAGLDIKAKLPEEVALSILAEIVTARRGPASKVEDDGKEVQGTAGTMKVQLDIICGMSVDPSSTKFISEFQGKQYFFCSAHCKHVFDKGPEKALVESQET